MAGATNVLMAGSFSPVVLTDRLVSATDSVLSPTVANAFAGYELTNGGVAQSNMTPGGTTSFAPEWLRPGAGTPSDYEVRFSVFSGTPSGGPFGVWLSLGTTRGFSVSASRSTPGFTVNSGVVTVEIRQILNSIIVATATITVSATASVEV